MMQTLFQQEDPGGGRRASPGGPTRTGTSIWRSNPGWTQWAGQRVWIAGASSGIGAALARALIQRGATVVASARSVEPLNTLCEGARHALPLPFDVSDPKAWAQAYQAVLAAYGGIDLIVFAAADYRPGWLHEVRQQEVQRILQVNLASVYYGLEQVLPDLVARQQGGVVVIGSVAGYAGLPRAGVYGSSKAALIHLAEQLHAEVSPQGLGVYLVNPGFVRTRLTALNDFRMPALMDADDAAQAILDGLGRGHFEIHFPKRFTWWMKLLQLMPYRLRLPVLARLTTSKQ